MAHSALEVSKGSAADIDLALFCIWGALLGAGDVFLTISFSHCSGLGSGATVSMGTIFCGDAEIELIVPMGGG